MPSRYMKKTRISGKRKKAQHQHRNALRIMAALQNAYRVA